MTHFGRGVPRAVLAILLVLTPLGCGGGQKNAGAPPPAAPAISVDAPEEHVTPPVAVVNGVTVYRATYEAILEALRDRIPPGDPDSVERYVGARDLALDKAIDEELLFQHAVKEGYGPTPEEVTRGYSERVGKLGSEERVLSEARNMQLSKSELLYSYRRTMAIDRLVKNEIEAKLAAAADEVRGFYETHPELFTPDRWLKVAQIFVNAPIEWPAEKRTAALTRITRGLEQIQKGRSFESIARDISEDEAASSGGMLGFVKRGGLGEDLDRAIFALQPGQMSGLVESPKGYHLLKVYESKGGQLEAFDKAKDQAKEKLLRKKRADALVALLQTLRASATIERLAS